jgi:type VI secretion system protein VasG
MKRIGRRVRESYGASFEAAPEVLDAIVARCQESESGARNIETILNRTLLPELSALVLERLAGGGQVGSIHVGLGAEGGFTYALG